MSLPQDVPGEVDENTNNDTNEITQVDRESERVQQICSPRDPAGIKGRPLPPTPEESFARGLPNEDLWMLLRRFNKQIYYVKAIQDSPSIDLNRAEDERYPPGKLRTTIERFYTSVVVGVVNFFNHIGRLRSWKEPRRTFVYCAAYFTAWLFDLLIPVLVGFVIALIWCPRIRPVLFPPAPQVKVDPDAVDANKQAPPGESASHDSVTGAPERHKGEAAEREAQQLVNSLASVAVQGAAGKFGQGESDSESPTEASFVQDLPSGVVTAPIPNPPTPAPPEPEPAPETASLPPGVITAPIPNPPTPGPPGATTSTVPDPPTPAPAPLPASAPATPGIQTDGLPSTEKTKKPMKKKVSKGTNQTMRVLSDITDLFEKFSNALSPTLPFYGIVPRLQLAGLLASMSLISFVSSYWIVKGGAFAVGFGFFGDPVIQGTVGFLNRAVPDWKKYLDLQKTILKGTPTNAQLTLTLLRMGEVDSAPLPPPPSSEENEPAWPTYRKKFRNLTNKNKNKDKDTAETLQDGSNGGGTKPKRRWAKVLRFVKSTIAIAIKSHATFDRAIAVAGASHSKSLFDLLQKQGHTKSLLSLLHNPSGVAAISGPLKFDAKFERKRGAVVVDSSKEPAVLYFTTYQSAGLDDLRIECRKKGSVLFQLPVTDIDELKKTEGLGWKGKLIVELTAGSKESADGLIISGSEIGQKYHVTGMRERDQLFNRLVAIGVQFWESR